MKYRIAKIGCLPLLLLQLSCTRPFNTAQTTPEDTHLPPRTVALNNKGELQELPPPADVALKSATPSENKLPPTVIDLREKQKELQTQVAELNKRTGEFLPAFEAHNQRLKRLEEKVPAISRELQQTADKFDAANTQLDRRVTALESEAHGRTPRVSEERQPTQPSPAKTDIETEKPAPPEFTGDNAPAGPQVLEKIKEPFNLAAEAPPAPKVRQARAKKVLPLPDYARELREQAKAAYQKVLADYPLSPAAVEAGLGLAALAEEEEDWETALAAYKHIDEHFVKSYLLPEALYKMAECQMKLEEYEGAKESFRRLAYTYPAHKLAQPALLAAAECLAALGKPEEALKEFKAIERANYANNFSQAARLQEIKLLMKMNKDEEAQEVLDTDPKSNFTRYKAEVESLQIELYLKTHKFKEARAKLQDLLAWRTNGEIRLNAFKQLARAYREDNDPLNAARIYIYAAKEPPPGRHTFDCRLLAADCYLDVSLPKQVTEQLDEVFVALAGAADDLRSEIEPQTLFKYAHAELLAGHPDQTLARLAELQRKYPGHELLRDAPTEKARALAQMGKEDEAIVLLRQIIAGHPRTPQAANALASLNEIQGKLKSIPGQENIVVEELVKTTDKIRAAQLKLSKAKFLVDLGRVDEAQGLFKELLSDPKLPKPMLLQAHWHCALLDQHAGRGKEALNNFKAVQSYDKDKEIKGDATLAELIENANWNISRMEESNKNMEWLKKLQQDSAVLEQTSEAKKQPF